MVPYACTMNDTNAKESALQAEQADNLRLKKADEFVEYCRQKENEARRALAEAVAQTQRAKQKWSELFQECEKRACARRKSGQIEVSRDY